MTTCLVTLGRHTRSLRFANLLLGNSPPLQPEVRLYQRLLSRDPLQALEFVDSFLKELGRLNPGLSQRLGGRRAAAAAVRRRSRG